MRVFFPQLHCTHLRNVGLHPDTDFLQNHFRHGSGRDSSRRFAGRTAPAAPVVAGAVLGLVGVVGVGRAVLRGDVRVILAPLVLVSDDEGNGRPGGFSLEHARHDLKLVGFFPLRCNARLAGLAAVEFTLDKGRVEVDARRTSIENYANARAVRFAEGGYF